MVRSWKFDVRRTVFEGDRDMARPGYSAGLKAGGNVHTIVVPITGNALEAFAAGTHKLTMPQTGKIVGISYNAGRKGGTHSVSTIDVLKGATSLLAALIDVAATAAGTQVLKEGAALAAAAATVAKDAVLSITLAESGGTSPTLGMALVQIDYVPLGD
jgi:hypothetical protein